MNEKLALALMACLCVTACEQETTVETPVISENEAVGTINAAMIETHYNFLADDALEGRMTGETGYDTAAEYVADFFQDLGLEPGGEDGWYQQVVLRSFQLDTETATLIAHRDGVDSQLTYREDFGMFGDKVREKTSVRAPVVYAGYGVHAPDVGYSDYDNIDVEGKIVALFTGAPPQFDSTERAFYASSRTKAKEAIGRGAVGFVALRSRRSAENFTWDRYKKSMGKKPGMTWLSATGQANDFFEESLGTVVLSAATATEMFSGTPISFEEARDAMEEGRPSSVPLGFEVTIETTTRFSELTSPNVIGIVRGTDPELANEYVVFTGHLDHLGRGVEENGDDIYNGAYDNAMGIALMMEAARAFAAKPPRRSVMFIALTAEERGLLGSDYFVHYPTVPIESLVANVNLDMPLFLYPVADLIAFGSQHSSLATTVEAAVAAESFELTPDPLPEENLFIRSDQYSFVRKGVPSIYLIPGFKSTNNDIDGEAMFQNHLRNHYHRPSDDLTRPVHWPSAERFARAKARIGYEIADADGRPMWNKGDFFGEKFGIEGVTSYATTD